MPVINFNQFHERLKTALTEDKPFSHTRYGDGEGIVIGPSGAKRNSRWKKWLGEPIPNQKTMDLFSDRIKDSVRSADIVGIPCKRHQKVNQDWRNVKLFLDKDKLIGINQDVCCMDCTVELQEKGLIRPLLSKRKELFYISCRDVDKEIHEALQIDNVEGFHLPPQFNPCKGKVLTPYKHYPHLFNQIVPWISENTGPGKLFLVGAGGLGKIYCHLIKQGGGIALDVGSLFDGWKGVVTRSYLKEIGRYRL